MTMQEPATTGRVMPWLTGGTTPPAGETLDTLRKKYPGLTDAALQMMLSGTIATPEPVTNDFNITGPWQPEHWTDSGLPDWATNVLKVAGVAGMAGLGALAAPAVLPALGATMPAWAPAAGAAAFGLPTLAGVTGGGRGGGVATPTTTPTGATKAPTTPPADTTTPPTPKEYTGAPFGQPQVVDVGGVKFWWNPMGNEGIGSWDTLPAGASGAARLTPEQEVEQAQKDRDARAALQKQSDDAALALQRLRDEGASKAAIQAAQDNLNYLNAQLAGQMAQVQAQIEGSRTQQAAKAAQDMANMYAADPYKYWAQLGTPTPAAVARLTGGQVGAGQPFKPTPLSVPSSQWWGNLLPSEQQQISGGLNWMGINPEDWYSMYQRMIPGLGARQVEPAWAR